MLLLQENFSLEALFGDPISAIITATVIVITLFTGYLVRKGWLNKVAIGKIKEALNTYKKSKSPDSPGGTSITEEEDLQNKDKALDAIEEALEHHGINIDLNGDGK